MPEDGAVAADEEADGSVVAVGESCGGLEGLPAAVEVVDVMGRGVCIETVVENFALVGEEGGVLG